MQGGPIHTPRRPRIGAVVGSSLSASPCLQRAVERPSRTARPWGRLSERLSSGGRRHLRQPVSLASASNVGPFLLPREAPTRPPPRPSARGSYLKGALLGLRRRKALVGPFLDLQVGHPRILFPPPDSFQDLRAPLSRSPR